MRGRSLSRRPRTAQVDVESLGARQCRDPDACRSGIGERLRGSSRRSAGSEYVVDDEDVFARDGGRVGDAKGSAKILPALTRCKSGLARGRASADESTRSERETPLGMRLSEYLNSAISECARLIESASGPLGSIQRNRDDEHFSGCFRSEFFNRLRQHATENAVCSSHATVLKRMNSIAQAAFVRAVGNRPEERGRRKPASPAKMSS